MKVTFTKRSHINMSNFDFLTEALLQEENDKFVKSAMDRVKQAKEQLIAAEKALNDAKTDEEKNKAIRAKNKANKTMTIAVRNLGDILFSKYNKNNSSQSKEKTEVAANRFIKMMQSIGNSLSGFFNILMGWLKELPDLAKSILGKLKDLWKKIKEWCSKSHIISKAKLLSKATVAYVGFIAGMVVSWIYSIIYGKYSDKSRNTRWKAMDRQVTARLHMANFNRETAVFIEEFGEILREDSNGGMFMAMAKKVIAASIDKIDAICEVAKNSSNIAFKKLSEVLSICTKGPNTILTNNINLATVQN